MLNKLETETKKTSDELAGSLVILTVSQNVLIEVLKSVLKKELLQKGTNFNLNSIKEDKNA